MAMEITLTDGGIETRIIYEFRRSIGDFEAYKLLRDEPGREILRRIYQSYAEVAVRYRLPIQLGTPTWRASRKWTSNVEGVNAAAVELLGNIARQIVNTRIILAGVIGPASDGYAADEALSTKDAFAYHREQADVLARTMSIFSTRQLFRHSRNCMALPERWQERAAHMRWRPCCIPMVRCSMERHWRKRSRASML